MDRRRPARAQPANRVVRNRDRAARACRPGRRAPSSVYGWSSQVELRQFLLVLELAPPDLLVAGAGVRDRPAQGGGGLPEHAADQEQPARRRADLVGERTDDSFPSRDSRTALRPHAPGSSTRRNRSAGAAVASSGSPRASRQARTAGVGRGVAVVAVRQAPAGTMTPSRSRRLASSSGRPWPVSSATTTTSPSSSTRSDAALSGSRSTRPCAQEQSGRAVVAERSAQALA